MKVKEESEKVGLKLNIQKTRVGPASIPGWGTKILQAALCSQNKGLFKRHKQTYLQNRNRLLGSENKLTVARRKDGRKG